MNAQTATAAATSVTVRAAIVDYTSKGNCLRHWFRMVLRDGEWVYFAEKKATAPNYGAASRNQKIDGQCAVGEIVLKHDYKGGVTEVAIVREDWDGRKSWEEPLIECKFLSVGGKLIIAMPDGSELELPNPRS